MKRAPLPPSRKPLARTSPMRRTRMRRKPRKARATDDPKRLRWVRRQPCAACGRSGFSHAHHPRHGVGLALKAPDSDAIPLCSSDPRTGRLGCHEALHGRQGRFAGWTAASVAHWEAAMVQVYRVRYAVRAA